MTLVGRSPRRSEDQIIREAAAQLGPRHAARRQMEIDALPVVTWKGRTLYTIRCQGTSGQGSHDVNVPLVMLWQLVSLRHFYCPYHAGDAWRN